MSLTQSSAWTALAAHQREVGPHELRQLFAADTTRFQMFSTEAAGLFLDYSKNRIVERTMPLLVALAEHAHVPAKIAAMFAGEPINHTERRAVLHTALRNRSEASVLVDGRDVMPDVLRVLSHMREFVEAVRGGKLRGYSGKAITDVVNIGIGGSYLGPLMVCRALRPYCDKVNVHFVSNVDGTDLAALCKRSGSADHAVRRCIQNFYHAGNADQCTGGARLASCAVR